MFLGVLLFLMYLPVFQADNHAENDVVLQEGLFDLKKLIRMIKLGKIKDSKTICAVLTYAAKNKLY